MSAVALHHAERRVIRALQHAGARSSRTAHTFTSLRRLERNRLDRLVGAGVVRQADGGGYYLEADALADYTARRRQFTAIAVTAALIVMVLILLLSRRPYQ